MPGDYVHIYFQREEVVGQVKEIAEDIHTSVSAIVSGLVEASLPALKEAVKKNQREVKMTITVPLFGSGDGQA